MTYDELEAELLKLAKQLDPAFEEELLPYLMLDLLEDGCFGKEQKK
jgi:hypothetical protein